MKQVGDFCVIGDAGGVLCIVRLIPMHIEGTKRMKKQRLCLSFRIICEVRMKIPYVDLVSFIGLKSLHLNKICGCLPILRSKSMNSCCSMHGIVSFKGSLKEIVSVYSSHQYAFSEKIATRSFPYSLPFFCNFDLRK